jgi:hypothetical protein
VGIRGVAGAAAHGVKTLHSQYAAFEENRERQTKTIRSAENDPCRAG